MLLSQGSTVVSDGYQLVHGSTYFNDFKASSGTVYTFTNTCQLLVLSTGEKAYVVSKTLGTVNAYDASKLGPLAAILQCTLDMPGSTNGLGDGNLACADSDGVSIWQTDSTGRLSLGNSLDPRFYSVGVVVKFIS